MEVQIGEIIYYPLYDLSMKIHELKQIDDFQIIPSFFSRGIPSLLNHRINIVIVMSDTMLQSNISDYKIRYDIYKEVDCTIEDVYNFTNKIDSTLPDELVHIIKSYVSVPIKPVKISINHSQKPITISIHQSQKQRNMSLFQSSNKIFDNRVTK